MNNIKFRVLFDGPDDKGIFYARVGKYICYASTHMDAETKESMIKVANEQSNIIMDAPDTAMILTFCDEVVSAELAKEDLAGCVENEARQCAPGCT